MALPVAPVLLFKLVQIARCFKPSPTYCCLAVPLLTFAFTSTSFADLMPRLLRELV